MLTTTAGLTGLVVTTRYVHRLSKHYGVLNKPIIQLPILGAGFYLSKWLYERTTNYYLNFFDRDVAHTNIIDLAEKYQVKQDNPDGWENNIALTPFDTLRKDFTRSMQATGIDGEKVFRRLGKDKNDVFYSLGKVRNLENMVYLDPKELEDISSPLELQMKIDSVTPTLIKSGDMTSYIDNLHKNIEKYKYTVENSKNFRSIKDKFLGLPFMARRHQQHPEPTRGTWQYDLYENIFNEPYDYRKDKPETEEKINKFNYHQFLHPSVIAKYDTDSEEFDMYLRQLNLESRTGQEVRSKQREFYCKTLMPYLNVIRNKEDGYDFANYVLNKGDEGYEKYFYEQYSGQKEEFLFREVEEYNYLNKNQPFVERTQYSTIPTGRIGIKASELEQILNNPTKAKNLRRAMERSYPHYHSQSKMDKLKYARHRALYIQTILDHEVDLDDPKWIDNVKELQEGVKEQTEEEQAMLQTEKDISITGRDESNNPLPKRHFPHYYNTELDWNDYNSSFPKGFFSPKRNRYELLTNYLHYQCKCVT
jgi:hypothetical protein